MAASAADVRSILSLPDPATNSTAGPSQLRRHSTVTRKPEGISRELYSLIGDSVPSLTHQLSKPRLKQKPNLGSGGPRSRWEWRAFSNGARSDGLTLSHWIKTGTDSDTDYSFAKYSVHTTPYTYSDEEYTRLLEDPDWTKEETDYLFQLVEEYDSRFFIIHDRYEYPEGKPRTLEDIKDRYYSVCRKLIRSRPWGGDEASRNRLINIFTFDRDREFARKQYVISLESRTPEQIAEEEALYMELKRLEQNERQFKKDRDDLLRTLLGIESGLADIHVDDDAGLSSLPSAEPKKKKKSGHYSELDSPMTATPSGTTSFAQQIPPKRAQSARSIAYDATHCITRIDPPPATATATKAAHQPVYLRSFKLPAPKMALAGKVGQLLAEQGITYTRLVMPTRDNCAQLETLIEAASSLLDTKKVADRVEQDIRVMKARLMNKESYFGGDTDIPMDVDQGTPGDGEVVDEREQSVISTKSARGRKSARRSMSVSSADTNAPSTRSTKRQKH